MPTPIQSQLSIPMRVSPSNKDYLQARQSLAVPTENQRQPLPKPQKGMFDRLNEATVEPNNRLQETFRNPDIHAEATKRYGDRYVDAFRSVDPALDAAFPMTGQFITVGNSFWDRHDVPERISPEPRNAIMQDAMHYLSKEVPREALLERLRGGAGGRRHNFSGDHEVVEAQGSTPERVAAQIDNWANDPRRNNVSQLAYPRL